MACLFLLRPGPADARLAPHAEHTVWVHIETTPNGAALHAPALEDGSLGAYIGTTPCVIAVDLKWGRRWFVKRWDDLRPWSPGNISYATRQADLSYDLFLGLTLVKEGYREQTMDARILTLKHPGKGWAGRDAWPTQARFFTTLEPLPARSQKPSTTAPASARRIILADSTTGASGTLTVHANTDLAHVMLDGKLVGTAPLQIVLKEGRHLLEVHKPGYHPLRREILIDDDAEVAYRAILKPVTP